jgi:RNA polymerase sigma factor (TIGR02999 family)
MACSHEVMQLLIEWSEGNQSALDRLFGVAAKAMRNILVDHARAEHAARRGGQKRQAVSLNDAAPVSVEHSANILALDDALKDLGTRCPRQSQVVELHYFGGLSNEEIAETLGVSPATVIRDWRAARAWLSLQLDSSLSRQAQSAP